ncbi:YdcF family protein [Xenophilus sp. Marseille-Q4582]|uniref:YdcF family protein n=1 Tax=Xenophilus sp. Marseille-Q4582 TaxID=2866600 RepID=UPI001CE4ADA3|nr:YdcF family protein [Xenophilus sp. Marseille-Q4582]
MREAARPDGPSLARAGSRIWLRRVGGAGALLVLAVAGLGVQAWWHGRQRMAAPPPAPADVALVLGNRAWIDGAPNPCLRSRVEAGVTLARAGRVSQLLMSGGVDHEDGRIEAVEMEALARAAGHAGPVLREAASQSTRENLMLSWPLLAQAGVRRVVIVSEAGHLWRVQRLAARSGFDQAFEVQYQASQCDRRPLRALQAALREPLAILKNAAHGWI